MMHKYAQCFWGSCFQASALLLYPVCSNCMFQPVCAFRIADCLFSLSYLIIEIILRGELNTHVQLNDFTCIKMYKDISWYIHHPPFLDPTLSLTRLRKSQGYDNTAEAWNGNANVEFRLFILSGVLFNFRWLKMLHFFLYFIPTFSFRRKTLWWAEHGWAAQNWCSKSLRWQTWKTKNEKPLSNI